MNLGETIYKLRTGRSLSQGDLADALDVSRQSVSKWENNMAVPDLDKLIKMSQLFGVTLDELVTGKTPVPSGQIPFPTMDILALILFVISAICLLVTMLFGDQMGLHSDVGPMLSLEFILTGVALLNRKNRVLLDRLVKFAIPALVVVIVFTLIIHILPPRVLIYCLGYGLILLAWWLYLRWSSREN